MHTDDEDTLLPPRFRFGRALLAFIVSLPVAWFVLFELAITIVPPRTSDGHPVMAIGQVGFAMLAAPLVAALLAWTVGRTRALARRPG